MPGDPLPGEFEETCQSRNAPQAPGLHLPGVELGLFERCPLALLKGLVLLEGLLVEGLKVAERLRLPGKDQHPSPIGPASVAGREGSEAPGTLAILVRDE